MITNANANEILLQTFQILNVLFPSIPFFFQIKKFYANKSSVGFSRKLPVIIIVASVLRVFFWFGKRFHWTLLVQSVVLILMQLFVIAISIKFRHGCVTHENLLNKNTPEKWNSSIYYIAFLVLLVLILEIISVIFTFQNVIYVEVIGTTSSFLEAALVIPQIIENCRIKSTRNLSNVLVACWVLGDSMKTFYYYTSNAPLQLLISGIAQIFLDFVILFQICIYRRNKEPSEPTTAE